MTGFSSSKFRHDCSKVGCYMDTLPCLDDLIKQFPRGICPTDIDAMVHIHDASFDFDDPEGDHFLWLESKGAGAPMYQPGQGEALLALSRIPRSTVLVYRPNSTGYDVAVWDAGKRTPVIQVSTDELPAWVRWWSLKAAGQKAAVA